MAKGKSFSNIIFLLIIFAALLVAIVDIVKTEDKRKADIEYLKNALEKNIVKIRMREVADIPEYAEFSDTALIEEVTDCFKTAEIGSVVIHSDVIYGGGSKVCMYFDDSKEMILPMRSDEILINGTFYQMKSFDWDFFYKIYKKSVERGYLKRYKK